MRLVYSPLFILPLLLFLVSCSDSGRSMDFEGNKVLYATTVTRVEASKLGKYLRDSGYFTHETKERLRLRKEERDYHISWEAGKEFSFSGEKLAQLRALKDSLSVRVFDSHKVTIELTDSHFRPKWEIANSPGDLRLIGAHELYIENSVNGDEADSLVNFLTEYTHFLDVEDDKNTMQFSKFGDKYIFRIAIDREALFHPLIQACRNLQTQLTTQVFPDALVDVEICDRLFDAIEVIQDQPYSKRWELGEYAIDYSDEVSLHEVATLRDYLADHSLLSHSKENIGLSKRSNLMQVAYQSQGGVHDSSETVFGLALIDSLGMIFNGETVEIQLHDPKKNDYRIISKP